MLRILLKNKANLVKWDRKSYHSKTGVYGYMPRQRKPYKTPKNILDSRNDQSSLHRWIEAYRNHGHRVAATNPVNFYMEKENIDELDHKYYGLHEHQLLDLGGILNVNKNQSTVKDAESLLKEIYCGSISTEFAYIESEEERNWLACRFEQLHLQQVSNKDKIEIAKLLLESQAFDTFLANKFPTVKRYGGEGAENTLTFFKGILEAAGTENLEHIVLGMPHRGRNNLLTVMFNIRPAKFFRKIRGKSEFPNNISVMGDVVSHYHASEELDISGEKIRISVLRNPSHLEAVNPVSMGKTRSKQQSAEDGSFDEDDPQKLFSSSILNVQLHGDAAFAGQGINQECLTMMTVPHYEIGGTIHMVVNNQVGFTTPGYRGRSSRYTTDLAKVVQAPVFHVNGDDPERLLLVSKLAFDYQREFRKDVFIDLNCFRRWGHNEVDDPTFTNPLLYKIIHHRQSVPDLYSDKLIKENILTKEEVETFSKNFMDYLNDELANVENYEPEESYFKRQWSGVESAPSSITYWDTGLDYPVLRHVGEASVYYPRNFNIHPHLLKTHVNSRLNKLKAGNKIDWATAEAFAFGSLMYQGHNVRISGQDVGRGTFSHRHAMIVDQETNEMFIPLNSLEGGLGGKLEVANSILSEEAVLGFEYGMSIDNPNNLIIWEAQFGDFANTAQTIIDTYIVSGETKWMQCNGLVILLPHGYDGAASEHSSCRMERFLQLCDSKENSPDGDDVNIHIINPTTPAQYYHSLRRQLIRNFRKPLLVAAPKTLLRLSDATSTHRDFGVGQYFHNVIGDETADPTKVEKIVLCSGKHYYTLNDERIQKNLTNVALVRLESLCPFPLQELQMELEKYKKSKTFIWSQEEARNMGAWTFVRPRFEYLLGKSLIYSGRPEAATVATGIKENHTQENASILEKTFGV